MKGHRVSFKTRLLSCPRSYSKTADGRHSQDAVQKDHHSSSSALQPGAAEPAPDLTSESHGSVCSGIPQLYGESQEAKVGASNGLGSALVFCNCYLQPTRIRTYSPVSIITISGCHPSLCRLNIVLLFRTTLLCFIN